MTRPALIAALTACLALGACNQAQSDTATSSAQPQMDPAQRAAETMNEMDAAKADAIQQDKMQAGDAAAATASSSGTAK